jgi:hypothetical protein
VGHNNDKGQINACILKHNIKNKITKGIEVSNEKNKRENKQTQTNIAQHNRECNTHQ